MTIRHLTLALATAATLALTACGTDTPPTQTDQPAPADSPTPSSTEPTLTRWVNVPCTPEGAKARTTSGGALVCSKVGSDTEPEWHAVTP